MDGYKLGTAYPYIDQLGYNELDQRTYMRYGNGAENKFRYDTLRRRLVQSQAATPAGRSFINSTYSYDAMNNITGVINNVSAQNNIPGGYSKQQYQYDNLYRLNAASGDFKGTTTSSGYQMTVDHDNLYNIVHKFLKGVKDQDYDQAYTYSGKPHQATQVGDNPLQYDLNGNQLLYGDAENFYDEENRLIGVLNKGVLNQYTYDDQGNRAVKSGGGIQGLWLNGAPAGAVKHNDNYTAYVNPYIECQRTGFVKHYYIENQRIVTKLGHGKFTNITFPTSALTAGNIDYGKRAAQIEQSRLDYYASLGVSPGAPTDKNYWARPENSGIAAPVYTDSTATMVPRGWPGNTTPPPNGPPVFVDPIPSNDSVKAGYGFNDPGHLVENSQYFYHPDLLGNTGYITNSLGEVSLHVEYSPLGETVLEEHTGSYTTPYLFNAKEKDIVTGYYFYGPRYYEPVSSQWLSTADPLGEKWLGEVNAYRRRATAAGEITGASQSTGGITGDVLSNGSYGESINQYETGDNEGEGDSKKKQPKNTLKATTPKEKQLQQMHGAYKRAFRQPRNPLQNNAMFFGHSTPVTRPRR